MHSEPDTTERDVEAFIADWADTGGSEQDNAQPFVIDLCDLLGVPRPRPQQEDNAANDYVFERSVYFKHPDGTRTPGRIDCYTSPCSQGMLVAARLCCASTRGRS